MSVDDFVAATGAPIAVAQNYLAASGGDLQRAIASYKAQRQSRGSRPGAGGVTSLRDLQEREGRDENNLFTGGERSGLEVEGPGSGRGGSGPDIVGRIIDQARAAPPLDDLSDDEPGPAQRGFSSADGFRLGTSTDGPATPAARFPAGSDDAQPPQRVKRTIFFWRDGFSVDEGDLYRYDDPMNQRYLEAINSGEAPLEVLGVVSNQYVDVRVEQRMNEAYVAPRRKPTFDGSGGQRLGTVGPRLSASPEASPGVASVASASLEEGPGGDTTVQVRLANGQQHRARFAGDGLVQQLYDYAEALNGGRPFVMSTMFPTRALEDRNETLAAAGLRNSVVVQRYA